MAPHATLLSIRWPLLNPPGTVAYLAWNPWLSSLSLARAYTLVSPLAHPDQTVLVPLVRPTRLGTPGKHWPYGFNLSHGPHGKLPNRSGNTGPVPLCLARTQRSAWWSASVSSESHAYAPQPLKTWPSWCTQVRDSSKHPRWVEPNLRGPFWGPWAQEPRPLGPFGAWAPRSNPPGCRTRATGFFPQYPV